VKTARAGYQAQEEPMGKGIIRVAGLIAAALTVSIVMHGCAATQPAGDGGTSAPVTMSPADQCAALQAAVDTADLAIVFVKIKDATAQAAIDAAFSGVQSAAADYCDAVSRGDNVNGLQVALAAYRTALADFKAQLRAARAAAPKSS
jgi:hypothetical protein